MCKSKEKSNFIYPNKLINKIIIKTILMNIQKIIEKSKFAKIPNKQVQNKIIALFYRLNIKFCSFYIFLIVSFKYLFYSRNTFKIIQLIKKVYNNQLLLIKTIKSLCYNHSAMKILLIIAITSFMFVNCTI